ncbi:predicted protein [Uncinocarpus reesii 1704]|uniref:Neutral protease 2 homolog UREG_02006 n=1 Tax=Uncinocarpus reesii (strain UAMH 1704) TaxID=336963 RepID=NPIIB_UNCRE|nr:uncharacterized protein UREG_02006 [Uncinocarpus reesii 1704]C4JK49.1 RecName: Full=Neutral protease 2 homolog UREG_02006; AltName: Full=Deuterolysin UREG_02006; Flags: Precursor [Uncinocarpus reesii 1704]EEP77157.1 predicted protein [Uncinocarpus reesii 1704]
MLFSSRFLALAALLGQALALPIDDFSQSDAGLKVKLTSMGNTRVKAVVTNEGEQEISFLKFNTFFDSAPTQKVQIMKAGSLIPFSGVDFYFNMANLPAEAFKTLAPGASAEAEFDIAATADLSPGGSYTVSSAGFLRIAGGNGTAITGRMRYRSNQMKLNVDGDMAAKVQSAVPTIEKRTRIDGNSCRGNYGQLLSRALQGCSSYAGRAAQAASNGDAQKFQEYFKTNSPQVRQSVAARFQAIVQECSSASNGKTTYLCEDRFRFCQPGLIAYTIPTQSVVANCPSYWKLPPVVNRGLEPDHGYVVVHEFTHATSIFSPGTEDHGYGYEECRRLNAQQSLSNADNYSLFAAAVSRGA